MVFKRYINKNGKKLGPYYYKNVRDKNGNVKTIYLGTKNPEGENIPKLAEVKAEKIGVYRVDEDKILVKEEKSSYIPSFSIRTNLIISLILLLFVLWVVFSDSQVNNELAKITTENSNLEIDQSLLRFFIKGGDNLNKEIKITNLGENKELKIVTNLDIVKLDKEKLYLNSGEIENLKVNINSQSYNPGVYSGKISLIYGKDKKDIPIIIEIESKNPLFDVNLNIPEREIKAGNDLILDIAAFNLMNEINTKVNLNYFIKDLDKNVISDFNEEVIIKDRDSYSRGIFIPNNINPGRYIVGIVINYGNSYGTTSYFFNVIEQEEGFVEKLKEKPIYLVLFSLAILIILILSTYFHYHIGRKVHEKMHGKKSSFIIIFIMLLILFIIYRTGLIYKNQIIYYVSIYWPIIKAKIVPVLLMARDYIPFKNPLFYPVLEIVGAFVFIIVVLWLHKRKTNPDVRNYIILKKLLKIINKEKNKYQKRELYKKALNLYQTLTERKRKKLEKKIINLSYLIKNED